MSRSRFDSKTPPPTSVLSAHTSPAGDLDESAVGATSGSRDELVVDCHVWGPVLVVDDDRDCRVEVREILEEEGFGVVEADNGKVALDYLLSDAREPCLVLLDLRMPIMSGVELLNVLKLYLRLSQIPVVLVSGARVDLDVELSGSFARLLAKPYSSHMLREAVVRFARPQRVEIH